jgi:uncharacterized protein YycO
MMRFLVVTCALVSIVACDTSREYQPQNGDIIFQTSRSSQSLAIQKATNAPYSHMGLVFVQSGQPMVFEAVEPVKSTPLAQWIARGEREHYVVKRLADVDAVLTEEALQRMLDVGHGFLGKHYDLYFEWSDERVYCSELVWKIYKRALEIEIGRLEPIATFDLSDPVVQRKVQERWGGPPPGDELVISPAAMFNSDRLVTVYQE